MTDEPVACFSLNFYMSCCWRWTQHWLFKFADSREWYMKWWDRSYISATYLFCVGTLKRWP